MSLDEMDTAELRAEFFEAIKQSDSTQVENVLNESTPEEMEALAEELRAILAQIAKAQAEVL